MADPRIRLLGSVPLFEGVSSGELLQIVEIGKELDFPTGGVIVEQGRQAMDFYLILSGKARVMVDERLVGTLGPGDHFGEMAVLDDEPRTATVTAETPVSLLRIQRNDFIELLDRNGSVGRKLLVQLSRRLREAQRASQA